MQYNVPAENHGRLLMPDYGEIPSVLASNEKILSSCRAGIRGIAVCDFRDMVRNRIAGITGAAPANRPVMITAHQPGFWHPGIMFKTAVAGKFNGDYSLLSVNVDSDVISPLAFKVPVLTEGRIHSEQRALLEKNDERIIEAIPVPEKKILDDVFSDVEDGLSTIGSQVILESFRRFRSIHESVYDGNGSLSRWLTGCRRQYFPVDGLMEIDLSQLCDTDEFRSYAGDILLNHERFHSIYNGCLDNYRRENKIRYTANPFPNLRSEGDWKEMPFWLITGDGKRDTFFVRNVSGGVVFKTESGTEKELGYCSPGILSGLRIRPKAVTMTMFMRLFAGSMFIHGIGGGNYDAVTDEIIRAYFDCEPPTYIVATKTEFLPIDGIGEGIEKLNNLRKEVRNMKFNPDEYVAQDNPLAKEKKAIIASAGNDTNREQFKRLKEIRGILVIEIEELLKSKERELKVLEEKTEQYAEAMQRDFPYFYFPVQYLKDNVSSGDMIQSKHTET